MSEQFRYTPPDLQFDPWLSNELARLEGTTLPVIGVAEPIVGRRSPFKNYVRMLTPEGGILILYVDQDLSLFVKSLRIVSGIGVALVGGWLIFFVSPLSGLVSLLAFGLLMLAAWPILRLPIEVSHSVEIRPDAMIIDDEDVFYAEDFGDTWPELQPKDPDGDPNRMVISGVCGTRYVELMTANRLDACDKTPEVLAADLKAAMEQLWGRREVTFPTAF